MAIKFSQLPKATTIANTTLVPVVTIGISSNVTGVVTGDTLAGFVYTTISGNLAAIDSTINGLQSNASAQQTTINSLGSSASSAASAIGVLQGQVGAMQANDASHASSITSLGLSVAGANAAIITANTALKGYVDAQDTAITNAWTANAASQNATLALKAPIASPTFTGTVAVPTLTVSTALTPTANASINLGSTSAWWNNIYGVAIQAKYADLAEKYLPDADYPVGTVLMIGGTHEVTACAPGHRAIGAVSDAPAYLMNFDLEGGVAVALKGRVPVRVEGIVDKGDRLVAGNNGAAVVSTGETFAIALEGNADGANNVVEALIL